MTVGGNGRVEARASLYGSRFITRFGVVAACVLSLVACGGPNGGRSPQSVYLDAVRHRNEVLLQIQAHPTPSWTDLRSLSAEMAQAEDEELSKLVAATWPSNAKPAVTALEIEIRAALPFWHTAAAAQTADEVDSNIDEALVYCGGPAAADVRSALGLPPA